MAGSDHAKRYRDDLTQTIPMGAQCKGKGCGSSQLEHAVEMRAQPHRDMATLATTFARTTAVVPAKTLHGR